VRDKPPRSDPTGLWCFCPGRLSPSAAVGVPRLWSKTPVVSTKSSRRFRQRRGGRSSGCRKSGTRPDDGAGTVVGISGQEIATDTLMVAFGVVVGDVLANKMAQVRFAKDDEVNQALMPDRPHEALSVGVAVRALGWDGDAGDAASGKEQLPLLRKQRVAVVNQELSAAQETKPSSGSQRLRRTWTIHASLGSTQMPAMCTMRVLNSMTKKTMCLTVPNAPSVSTLKKSQA